MAGENGPGAVCGPADVGAAPERPTEDGGPAGAPGEEKRPGEREEYSYPHGVCEREVGDVDDGEGAQEDEWTYRRNLGGRASGDRNRRQEGVDSSEVGDCALQDVFGHWGTRVLRAWVRAEAEEQDE